MSERSNLLSLAIVAACLAVLFALLALHFTKGQKDETLAAKAPSPEASAVTKAISAGAPRPLAREYVEAAQANGLPWQLLAGIGFAESDHGRSELPGVREGINLAGCCAGLMQLCVTDACGNVAADYAVDGDRDRKFSVYRPADAIWTAASYLKWMKGLLGDDPLLLAAGYNAGPTIVSQVGIPSYPETRTYVGKVRAYMSKVGWPG